MTQVKQNSPFLQQEEWMNKTDENYFLLLNLKQQIVTLNDAFQTLLNVNFPEANNRTIKNLKSCLGEEHLEWFEEFILLAQEGQTVQHEVLMKDNCNNERWIRFHFSPFYNLKNEIRGITCIGTNVNREKTQEKKLVMQNLLLSEIAYTYSHELRHPLTNILAIINIMKYENYKMTETYFEYLEIASKQLDAVIQNVVLQTYLSR